MVGVGDILLAQHWPNVSSPTVIMMLSAQRWHNATRPTVILTLSAQYWPNRNSTNYYLDIVGPMLAQHYTCQLMSAKFVFLTLNNI
jgi:hypothetical protein